MSPHERSANLTSSSLSLSLQRMAALSHWPETTTWQYLGANFLFFFFSASSNRKSTMSQSWTASQEYFPPISKRFWCSVRFFPSISSSNPYPYVPLTKKSSSPDLPVSLLTGSRADISGTISTDTGSDAINPYRNSCWMTASFGMRCLDASTGGESEEDAVKTSSLLRFPAAAGPLADAAAPLRDAPVFPPGGCGDERAA
mmetsp:Transcript_1153/g.2434  ORF Transcript_1153/g.2434 Transcript_1153/m.2434 type:complete len:200 (-) Transcript_1153:1156-1755(-)